MDINRFLNFDKMLTPIIIKIVFWIGVGASVLMGLFTVITGLTAHFGGGAQVVMGLLTIVLGPLVVRIYCELLIIMFKMHESLAEMKTIIANQSKEPRPETEIEIE